MTFIDVKILPSINKTLLKQAEEKMNDEGNHPLWNEADSIIGLIPSQTQELL